MQLLKVACFAIAAAVTLTNGSALAVSSVEEFWRVYPPAEEKLDRAYSQVRITVVTRWEKPPFGEVIEEAEYLRNGRSARLVRKPLNSVVPDWSEGAILVMVGDNKQWYEMHKARAESPFTFLIARAPASDEQYATALGMVYPTRIGGVKLSKRFREHPIIDVLTSSLDGLPAVEVRSQRTVDGKAVGVDRLYFDPDTWVLLGLSAWTSTGTWESRIAYQMSDGVPVIRSMETWSASAEEPELTFNKTSTEVRNVAFGPVPAEEFTLEAFGITERPALTVDVAPPGFVAPGHGSQASPSRWLYWAGAVVVALIGAVVCVLAVRRKSEARG